MRKLIVIASLLIVIGLLGLSLNSTNNVNFSIISGIAGYISVIFSLLYTRKIKKLFLNNK